MVLGKSASTRLDAGGVAPLQGIDEALAAIGGAAALLLPQPPRLAGVHEALDEWQGKQRLAEAGLAVPEGRLVDAAAAPEAAA